MRPEGVLPPAVTGTQIGDAHLWRRFWESHRTGRRAGAEKGGTGGGRNRPKAGWGPGTLLLDRLPGLTYLRRPPVGP